MLKTPADSAAILLEKIRGIGKELNVKTFRAEIMRTATATPWHKNNIMKCVEIGLSPDKFLQLCFCYGKVAKP